MGRRERLVFGLSLLAVVVVPGVATALLTRLGYETLATLAWLLGYGLGTIALWYAWVRPLDITGPDGPGHLDGEDSVWAGRDGEGDGEGPEGPRP